MTLKRTLRINRKVARGEGNNMQLKNELVEKLMEQREMLDELIAQIRLAARRKDLGRAYDRTTRNVERNLQQLRSSLKKISTLEES